MPKAGGKGRKTSNETSLNDRSNSRSPSVNMEIELLAQKAKNRDLTKAHTILLHENSRIKEENRSLQRDLVDLEVRCNSLESEVKKLRKVICQCAPSMKPLLDVFFDVTRNTKAILSLSNISNSFSEEDCAPKAKAITQCVKPHTVNGTVLNLNPTISLIRLSSNINQRSKVESSNRTAIDYMNSLPSTSNNHDNGMEDFDNEPLSSHNVDVELVSRRSQISNRTSAPLDTPSDDPEDRETDEFESEELADTSQEFQSIRRLTTIHEESISTASGSTRTSLGEVRIYLSRLSAEDIQSRNYHNESCSSTEPNVNDTCLNIETTVIENPETGVSQRLRVFSPHANSTRLEGDNSSFSEFNSREEHRSLDISLPENAIGSVESTPASEGLNEAEELSSNPLLWLPTPSLSAMGDIDKSNCSRLDILEKTERNMSPIPELMSPRNTRSKKKSRARTDHKMGEDSPRSSRYGGCITKRSAASFVTQHRRSSNRPVSNEIDLTPTIVLERLENNHSTERKRGRNLAEGQDADDPKENENVPVNSKDGLSMGETTNKKKLSKRNFKRKKIDEADSLQDKLVEVKIRLSNYIPDNAATSEESCPNSTGRPQRAAKPKTLKDASLKGKLRRMF